MSLDATHHHMNELIIILAINIKMVLPLFSQHASTHPSPTHETLQLNTSHFLYYCADICILERNVCLETTSCIATTEDYRAWIMQWLIQSTQKATFLQCKTTFLATRKACAQPLPADEHVINICFPPPLSPTADSRQKPHRADCCGATVDFSDTLATVA